MIRGRFVGKITINAAIEENTQGMLPYPKMKEEWAKTAEVIQELIADELGEDFDISVDEIEDFLERTVEAAP